MQTSEQLPPADMEGAKFLPCRVSVDGTYFMHESVDRDIESGCAISR